MNIYKPYTYLIGWSKHNVWYYGSRFCNNKRQIANPSDLWNPYKTSSIYVKQTIKELGEPDVIQVRKTFSSAKEALSWEETVIRRMNIVQSERWLNKNNAGKNFNTAGLPANNRGKPHTVETKIKMSEAGKRKIFSEKHRENLSKNARKTISAEHKKNIGQSNKGKKRSDPSKCATYGFLGKKLSAESIRKRTETRKRNRELKALDAQHEPLP